MNSNRRRGLLAMFALILVLAAAFLLPSGRPGPEEGNTPASLLPGSPGDQAFSPTPEPATPPEAVSEQPSGEAKQKVGAVSAEDSSEPPVQADLLSLSAVYADYFRMGAAIEPEQTEGRTAELLKQQVNWIVAENAMKPDAIEPVEGSFTWERADRIVAFAKANGMGLRFHTLVWHSQTPDWFFRDEAGQAMVDETDAKKREANKKLLLQRLDTYISTVVGRYKHDISSWDVVNEVIEPGDPEGMRASNWYKITGTGFIATAFRAARKAGGPDIKLYINDYGTDHPVKRDRLYDLVKGMLEKGVPIDGVGHQTHINLESLPLRAL